MRLALLTTASINGAILGARSDDAPFRIVAVGSRDAARAQEYARRHGIERSHGSYDAVLADDAVDAVYIALPAALHHEWTMRALEAGKHVLVEKPYTRLPGQVDEAAALATRQGLVLSEGYMWRHSPQTRLLTELLPRVGEVQAVQATFFGRLDDDADVRFVSELGGGALLDLGCYCVSAARLVLGEPTRAYGEAALGRGGVDERFAGLLTFGEVTAGLHCGFTARANRIEVVGRDGVLSVPQAFSDQPGIVLLDGEEHRVEPGNHYRWQLEDFCAAIRGERQALIGPDEMRAQARALDALLRSAERGEPVVF